MRQGWVGGSRNTCGRAWRPTVPAVRLARPAPHANRHSPHPYLLGSRRCRGRRGCCRPGRRCSRRGWSCRSSRRQSCPPPRPGTRRCSRSRSPGSTQCRSTCQGRSTCCRSTATCLQVGGGGDSGAGEGGWLMQVGVGALGLWRAVGEVVGEQGVSLHSKAAQLGRTGAFRRGRAGWVAAATRAAGHGGSPWLLNPAFPSGCVGRLPILHRSTEISC